MDDTRLEPPQAGQDPPPAVTDGFELLDRRAIHLWRVQQFIGTVILLSLAMVPAAILAIRSPHLFYWLLAAWLSLALARTFHWIWYPPRAYEAYGFRIDERVLEIRRGVVFKVIQLLPLSRLQHVDLQRGPIERYFGLTSLLLFTAGTHAAVISVPGLAQERALELRDFLVRLGETHGE